jgi:hypothetical protein
MAFPQWAILADNRQLIAMCNSACTSMLTLVQHDNPGTGALSDGRGAHSIRPSHQLPP